MFHSQMGWIQSYSLSYISCVLFGKLFNHSEPQCFHIENMKYKKVLRIMLFFLLLLFSH